jgi:LmbE family N-acetylglucosaminyl deacetylase
VNLLVIGAHPDDGEYRVAGTAVKLAARGHRVKFLNLTDGGAGHHEISGPALAARREKESAESRRRLGIDAIETWSVPDGELMPTLELRREVIRRIREWQADVVITHRPNDYHPDHRYCSVLVQDAAFMVTVPAACPDAPLLRVNPIFLYMEDEFTKPNPFTPDIVVAIDDVWDRKVASLDAHESQFYEWLPWLEGELAETPVDRRARREWLSRKLTRPLAPAVRTALERRYGLECAASIQHAEAFELCEYGRRPTAQEIASLFPA